MNTMKNVGRALTVIAIAAMLVVVITTIMGYIFTSHMALFQIICGSALFVVVALVSVQAIAHINRNIRDNLSFFIANVVTLLVAAALIVSMHCFGRNTIALVLSYVFVGIYMFTSLTVMD